MSTPNARTRDFFVTQVVSQICEKYGMGELEAVRSFVQSKTYAMLLNGETGLYQLSPGISFDLWESERVTGDPRNSAYIREEW